MADVVLTNFEPITWRLPEEEKNIVKRITGLSVFYDIALTGYATGDASGGSVYGEFDFTNIDPDLFYHIVEIYSSAEAAVDFRLYLETDRWECWHHPSLANSSQIIYYGDTVSPGIATVDTTHNRGIYLGKPRIKDADAGKLKVYWGTNTDTKVYWFLLRMLALDKPLPSFALLNK